MSKRSQVVSAALLTTMAGCMHAEFVTDTAPAHTVKLNNPFFIGGLIGENRFDARAICPDGVHKIDSYMSFGDGFLTAITFLIYTPRTVEITCTQRSAAAPAKFRLIMDEQDTVRAVGVQGEAGWRYIGRSVGSKQLKTLEVPR